MKRWTKLTVSSIIAHDIHFGVGKSFRLQLASTYEPSQKQEFYMAWGHIVDFRLFIMPMPTILCETKILELFAGCTARYM